MSKSVLPQLKKYLNELDEKELKNEILQLYKKFPLIKKYYISELSDSSEELLDEYKKKILKEYFPTGGFGKARNSECKRLLNEYKKIAVHKKDIVELLLYRDEMMLNFTNEYGDINEPFYNSLESSFEQACKLIGSESLEKYFKVSIEEIFSKSYDLGWGVYDGLRYSYDRFVGYE